MKFFFPDAQDLVDPSFDFDTERRAADRIRQRDDLYAHEVFREPVCDGLLVSKGIVDAVGEGTGRYSMAQRQRLLRHGVRAFFRVDSGPRSTMPIMGDCGAFTYVKEEQPPFAVPEVVDFYRECRFDLGISVDHVILAYDESWDDPGLLGDPVPPPIRHRQDLTLEYAREFLECTETGRTCFEPVGVAQGWSPRSYASAVDSLQKMGYRYVALGGMVPLKTPQILASLRAIDELRRPETHLHLLGVTRASEIDAFAGLGVVSFDSTSPLRQAFKDDRDNYYMPDGSTRVAIRVPQVESNPRLARRIRSGEVNQDVAREHERRCLRMLRDYDAERCTVEDVVTCLRDYEELFDQGHDRSATYAAILRERPWRSCGCEVCRQLGYHVILFRGAERNRRRGFHNLWVFYRRLQRHLKAPPTRSERPSARAVSEKSPGRRRRAS